MNNIWNQFLVFINRFSGDYFFSTPMETMMVWILIGTFLTFCIVVFCFYLYLRLSHRKNKLYQEYAKSFFWPNLTFGTIGLFLSFFRYENIDILSWRLWIYLNILIIIVFNVWILVKKRSELDDSIAKQQTKKRKEKWLTKK